MFFSNDNYINLKEDEDNEDYIKVLRNKFSREKANKNIISKNERKNQNLDTIIQSISRIQEEINNLKYTVNKKDNINEKRNKDFINMYEQEKTNYKKLENKIFKLEDKIQDMNFDIDYLRLKNNADYSMFNYEINKILFEQKNNNNKIKYLENKVYKLENEYHKLYIEMSNKKKENKALLEEIKEIKDFQFHGKLRKLVKKLIEYMIEKYYKNYMEYNRHDNILYFIDLPKNLFLNLNKSYKRYTISLLNKMIDKICIKKKRSDYVIHLFNPKVNQKPELIKKYTVFNNHDEFFKYFGMKKSEGDIISNIIPKKYFTIIDNASMDETIFKLIKNLFIINLFLILRNL